MTNESNIISIEVQAANLVKLAGELGVVLTIENESLKPPAMGNYRSVVTVYPAKNADGVTATRAMPPRNPELYKPEVQATLDADREAFGYINATPILQSLLYDINLLPEQLGRDGAKWAQMHCVVSHFKLMAAKPVDKPADPSVDKPAKSPHRMLGRAPLWGNVRSIKRALERADELPYLYTERQAADDVRFLAIATTPSSFWRADGDVDPHAGHYDGERASLALGDYTDDELANGAFLNYDRPLPFHEMVNPMPGQHMPIVWMTAVKERIRWLSRALEKALVPKLELSAAESDVIAERRRQVDAEGWSIEHDDEEHDPGELSAAAAAYALAAADLLYPHSQGDGGFDADAPPMWPAEWTWKPGTPRRMLKKAGGLILAEMEKWDRAAAKEASAAPAANIPSISQPE